MSPVRCAVELALRPPAPEDRSMLLSLLRGSDADSTTAGIRTSIIVAGGTAVGAVRYHDAPGRVHLLDLAVAPEWRGRGIATGVLDLLAPASVVATTSIRADDHRARSLCEHHGFSVVAEHVGRLLMATGVEA